MSQPDVLTFGCRLNINESALIKQHLEAAGRSNVVVVNTCAVTAEAERKARQSIRKLRRERPDTAIIVTGCAAQINPDSFADMPEVTQVIGNDVKLEAGTWAQPQTEKVRVNDIMSVKETAGHLVTGFEGHSRAFVQVQNGCNHRCTFCIIPYGRGNSRSVPVGEVVRQVQTLVTRGYKEVVLTGVDMTSYGEDLPARPSLGQLVQRVLRLVPDLQRLRLSSVDPSEIDDTLWDVLATDARFMPHLHLSVQAGDDMILKRMKRRHLRDDVLATCAKARALRPGIVFGADIIAGFPTETEAMFDNTLRLVREADLTWLHVFPYSARKGTPAARMPQVPAPLRRERAAQLREAGQQQVHAFHTRLISTTQTVLTENDNTGHTDHFAKVKITEDVPPGQIASVHITGMTEGCLSACRQEKRQVRDAAVAH